MYSDPAQIEAPAAIPLDCPSCGLPAQIVDRFTPSGSAGAVEHLKIVCTAGHWLTPPEAKLGRAPRKATVSEGSAAPVRPSQSTSRRDNAGRVGFGLVCCARRRADDKCAAPGSNPL